MFEFLAYDFPNTYYTDHIAHLILSSFPYYILLIIRTVGIAVQLAIVIDTTCTELYDTHADGTQQVPIDSKV